MKACCSTLKSPGCVCFWFVFLIVLFGTDSSAMARGATYNADNVELKLLVAETGKAWLRFRLSPGWKTYWRSPGDSGVALELEWEGSTNVADLLVRWPVPKRIHDGYGSYNALSKEAFLAIDVLPTDSDKPVILNLEIFFGICRNICIPHQAILDVSLPNANPADIDEFSRSHQYFPRQGDAYHHDYKLSGSTIFLFDALFLDAQEIPKDWALNARGNFIGDVLLVKESLTEDQMSNLFPNDVFAEMESQALSFMFSHSVIRGSEFLRFHAFQALPGTSGCGKAICSELRLTFSKMDTGEFIAPVEYLLSPDNWPEGLSFRGDGFEFFGLF